MGVTLKTTEMIAMANDRATKDGYYTLNGNRFRIRKGDALPEGAELDETVDLEADREARAESAAPENRMESVPENRAATGDDTPARRKRAGKDGE